MRYFANTLYYANSTVIAIRYLQLAIAVTSTKTDNVIKHKLYSVARLQTAYVAYTLYNVHFLTQVSGHLMYMWTACGIILQSWCCMVTARKFHHWLFITLYVWILICLVVGHLKLNVHCSLAFLLQLNEERIFQASSDEVPMFRLVDRVRMCEYVCTCCMQPLYVWYVTYNVNISFLKERWKYRATFSIVQVNYEKNRQV